MPDCRNHSSSFSGPCRVSAGVAAQVPTKVQAALWRLIGEKRIEGESLDFLQTFEITAQTDAHGEEVLVVVHRQDSPAFVDATVLRGLREKFAGHVWVIDDNGASTTMLLPEEYDGRAVRP